MAIPNIVNVTSIQAKSFGNTLTTSNALVLVNAASTGNCIKVNNIVISNYSNAAASANVEYNTAAAGTGTGGARRQEVVAQARGGRASRAWLTRGMR